MNDRLFTLLAAAVALVLFLGVLGVGPQERPPPVSRPGSQDTGDAGLLGLYRWLEASGVAVERLRTRYTALPELAPGTGNLLVAAEPMVWPVRPSESVPLHAWVERGNHLLLLSANAHVARWGWGFQSSGLKEALGLQRTHVSLKADPSDAHLAKWQARCSTDAITRGTIAGPQRRLRPADTWGHPVLDGVDEVHVKTPAPHGNFYQPIQYAEAPRRWYPLLCDPQLRLPVFNVFRVGSGRVWVLDYGETFSNLNLDRGDNAVLFSNLAAFVLGPRGRVVFDDMHQGDSELYDPDAFFGDPRLHGTLGFLLGMWLLWLLGYSSRFAPPAPAPARMTNRDFTLAVARFQARYLLPPEAARALFRHFFNFVRQRYRLPTTGEPAWDALQRAPGVSDATLRQLRAWHDDIQRGRGVDLGPLRNLLLQVQDSLT